MNLDNPIRMVRELKGAPLSILFALTIVRQRVSQAWLEQSTGYTDKTISQALGYLEEICLVDHTGAGWQLTGQARQLPMPLEIEGKREEEEEEKGEETDDINNDITAESRRISDPLIIINLDSEVENNNNNNITAESRNFSDPQDKNREAEAYKALGEAGIVGVKRQSLAGLRHVTTEWVELWDKQLRKEKGTDYRPGLLVRVLESGAEPEEIREREKWRREKCLYCGGDHLPQDCPGVIEFKKRNEQESEVQDE